MEKKIIGSFTCPTCGTNHTFYADGTSTSCTTDNTPAVTNHSPAPHKPSKLEAQLAQLAAKGFDISCYKSIAVFDTEERLVKRNADGSMIFVDANDPIFKRINDGGMTWNSHLFKQYVMAHLLAAAWDSDEKNVKSKKFTDAINNMRNVRRQFEIIVAKLNGICAMVHNGDFSSLKDELMWYNKSLCYHMVYWYIEEFLPKFVSELKVRKFRGQPYIYCKGFGKVLGQKGKYRGTLLSEMDNVYDKYKTILNDIDTCAPEDYETLRDLMTDFTELVVKADRIKAYHWEDGKCEYEYRTVVDPCFADAYKGYGAYFTGKNMIEFHKCLFGGVEDGTNNAEVSMKIWRKFANEHKQEGWWMFGALRRLISDNGFDYDAKVAEWAHNAKVKRGEIE